MSSPSKPVIELTLRGVILGILITLVFTAANVYLGLRVGLTFATSIPAAVISMAFLSLFKDSTILENNIVQTVASAAGTLSAIIFVLPGLLIVGWWVEFPFWQSFLICASGGILGVLFTIPLRRAMVVNTDLPYPEGVAAAEVLEVGDAARGAATRESREGLLAVVYGAVASAALAIVAATGYATAEFTKFFRLDRFGWAGASSGFDMGFSLALVGAGYLVGLSVGMAMLLGLVIAWGVAVPWLTAHPFGVPHNPFTPADLDNFTNFIWAKQVRFIGAGAIAVASVWTLIKLIGPVVSGVVSTLSASRAAKGGVGDRTDTDMSPGWIGLIALACLGVIAYLLFEFLLPTPLAGDSMKLVLAAVPFVFIGGFLIAAICGYMAGLIGASNSPISGVGILAIIFCAAVFVMIEHPAGDAKKALIAFALFATAIVFAIATISNNNLQDLKTGQLVKATPRAQQWALIVGVIAGAAVIPPVLNLLAHAFGFAGAPNIGTVTHQPLPAPQATLISALAQGVIGGDLNVAMLEAGVALGIGLIVLDELLGLVGWLRLSPLAVGIGIYLPMSATLPVVMGAIIGHLYDSWTKRTPSPEYSKRLAVLIASGMIVGESLWGVINAGVISATGSGTPFQLAPADFAWINEAATALFVVLIVWLYGWIMRRSLAHAPSRPGQ
ncbi:MAG: oligopeptide transporter, OPT family [Alphaproteobacteria bacterium]|nr:oligopeptide transporter, OPT family [Alphaproteobacteria bacterium]